MVLQISNICSSKFNFPTKFPFPFPFPFPQYTWNEVSLKASIVRESGQTVALGMGVGSGVDGLKLQLGSKKG